MRGARTIVVATRNPGKVREMVPFAARYLPSATLVTLADLGVDPDPEEERVEAFDSFEENALAKARYFRTKVGDPASLILAEDSGLCVDALDGAPGVRSRRFSGVSGDGADAANNQHLLERLSGTPPAARTARYRAVAVLLGGSNDPILLASGECEGRIGERARGEGGFGYDPIFQPREDGMTMAELSLDRKQEISHRGRALKELFGALAEVD